MSEKAGEKMKVFYVVQFSRGYFKYGIGERVGNSLFMSDGSDIHGYYNTPGPCFDMTLVGMMGAVELQRKLGIRPDTGDFIMFYDRCNGLNATDSPFKTIVWDDYIRSRLDLADEDIFVLMKSPL